VVRSLWLVVLVAACGKHATSDPTSCPAVGAKVRSVANAELAARADLAPTTRRDAQLQLGPLEHEVTVTCRDQGWPTEVRTCLVGATTGLELKACAAVLTPEQRGALPQVVKP
jgi:hypothetical protein